MARGEAPENSNGLCISVDGILRVALIKFCAAVLPTGHRKFMYQFGVAGVSLDESLENRNGLAVSVNGLLPHAVV